MKEKCIRCGRETKYEVSAPVTERRYYIEGSGQLCEKCFYELYPVALSFVKSNPSTSPGEDIPNKL